MTTWHSASELDAKRNVVAGTTAELADAIRRAADLRIYTEFLHNEHIDVNSPSAERIREVAEFGRACPCATRAATGTSAG